MATGLPIFNPGAPLDANGEDVAGSSTIVELAKITLQIDRKYERLNATGHCRTGALFQVVYNDNGAESVERHFGSDPGEPSPTFNDPDFNIDTYGKTGTQELILKFKNFGPLACARGSISTREFTA